MFLQVHFCYLVKTFFRYLPELKAFSVQSSVFTFFSSDAGAAQKCLIANCCWRTIRGATKYPVLRYWAQTHCFLASLLPRFQKSCDLKKLFLSWISSPLSSLARTYREGQAEKLYSLPFNHRIVVQQVMVLVMLSTCLGFETTKSKGQWGLFSLVPLQSSSSLLRHVPFNASNSGWLWWYEDF